MKKNAGITLIALVVTIIILIILAGVSINLVLGDNGVITRAKTAKEKAEQAQLNEQVGMNQIVGQMETIIGGTGTIINPGESGYKGGNYDDPYIPIGFAHTAETWNNGYTITETETGNKFVWVPCVTEQSKVKEGDNVVTFGKTLPSTTATTDPYYMYNQNNYTITGDENLASDIRTSVGTYGGFYIAAYEAGVPVDENGTEIAATSATTTQKARSVAGANTWTDITRANAIAAAANMVKSSVAGVNSGLISGEAWDTTLKWMVNTSDNALANVGYDTNSTGKGWYSDVSLNKKHTTGYYAVNNIYDMAGNVYEWTTENCTDNGSNYLVRRGGSYDVSGSNRPAAYRIYDSDNANYGRGFRVVIYK